MLSYSRSFMLLNPTLFEEIEHIFHVGSGSISTSVVDGVIANSAI